MTMDLPKKKWIYRNIYHPDTTVSMLNHIVRYSLGFGPGRTEDETRSHGVHTRETSTDDIPEQKKHRKKLA